MLFNDFPQKAWSNFWSRVLSDRISLVHEMDAEGRKKNWRMMAGAVNGFIGRVRKLLKGISSTGFDLIKISDSLKDSSSKMLNMANETEVHAAYSIEAMNRMTSAITQIANMTTVAAQSIVALKERTASAEISTESGVKAMESLSDNIQKWADTNRELAESISNIQKINVVIKNISEQTKLIAFNAALEASSAGEAGRRFGIVADEVRSLATQTARATKEISVMVQSIIEKTGNSFRIMEETLQQATMSMGRTNDVNASLKAILDEVGRISSNVNSIASVVDEQSSVSEGVVSAASEVSTYASKTKTIAMEMDSISNAVTSTALRLNDNLCIVKKDRLDEDLEQTLLAYASELKAVLEASLAGQEISVTDLFDEQYVPVDEKKFSARSDALFSRLVLPRIQEWSKSHERLIYVVVMDRNGYIPVHMNQARAGVLMTDEVSLGGAKSGSVISRAFKRPREAGGELVNDVSCPIVIKGRHWGCVRIGYLPLME